MIDDASAELLKLFFSNTPDNVYVKDTNSAFLIASKATATLMGIESPDMIIGKTDYDFFPKELADIYFNDEQYIIKTGVAILDKEEPTYIASNPAMRWLSTSKIPFKDSTGRIIGVMGMGRDITERRKIQETLRHQDIELAHQSGKAEVAADVMHNIGNVMNSIYVSAVEMIEVLSKSRLQGLVKANELMSSNRHDIVNFIQNDPKGLALLDYYVKIGEELVSEKNKIENELSLQLNKITIIKDILDIQQSFTKSSSYIEKLSIKQIVDESLLILQRLISKNRIIVECSIADDFIIMSNKAKLTHIFINLIKNAIEAMENTVAFDRCLFISAVKDNCEAKITFIDKGHGIEKDNLTRIFNHGFTTKPEGKGFGLHACANSITELKGKISATSDGAGKGATFCIIIPTNS